MQYSPISIWMQLLIAYMLMFFLHVHLLLEDSYQKYILYQIFEDFYSVIVFHMSDFHVFLSISVGRFL